MRIIVLLDALKVGSFRTRQMLKVDLCANGAGAYAPYAPPLPTGLQAQTFSTFCFSLSDRSLLFGRGVECIVGDDGKHCSELHGLGSRGIAFFVMLGGRLDDISSLLWWISFCD